MQPLRTMRPPSAKRLDMTTSKFLTTIRSRTPVPVKRAYRRGVSKLGATRARRPSGGDADRIATLEAALADERARARRAELRIDAVRQEAARAAEAAEAAVAAAVAEAAAATEAAVAQATAATEAADVAAARSADGAPPGSVATSSTTASAASRDGDLPPSFRYKLGEQRRISHELSDALGTNQPVWQVNPKLDGREWAAQLGIRVPELLAGPTPIGDLDVDALPDHFVIKPVTGHSSRGVFLLHRTGPDQYRSLLDRSECYSRSELVARYAQWLDKGSIPESVIVERLLFDGTPDDPRPPIDFRFFCFYGEVGFVMARDGHGTRAGSRVRFRFFDDAWEDLGQVRLDVKNDPSISVPRQAEAMIDTARLLSAAIPRPMVRIDLFDADDAVYFGEVTPFPGGNFAMAAEPDRRFGEQWERAEARLERDAIEAGIRAVRS